MLFFFNLCFAFFVGSCFGDNGKWEDSPDEFLNAPQIIRRHGYPAESHVVKTEDGYLLTLHRIPGSKNSQKRGNQPILLQHGLLSSSVDWIDEGNNSLAFLLADAGYDVWLGNARGNVYSTAHVSLPLDSQEFWDFSWHEMGIYDLPAVLQHISNETSKGGEILYVGHSMGTTMFYVLASMKPDVAKMVKFMVSFAPVALMTHVRSPIRYLTPFCDEESWIAKHLGIKKFLPSSKIIKLFAYECETKFGKTPICENVIFTICGFDKKDFNEDILPVILSHAPAGSSTKTVLHYGQEIRDSGKFQMYNYGSDGNLARYGTKNPPQYNVSNIEVPMLFMYAANDLDRKSVV